jgi:hypothetical protein
MHLGDNNAQTVRLNEVVGSWGFYSVPYNRTNVKKVWWTAFLSC